MNLQKAFEILNQLHSMGVKDIGLCPGGRNAPFVELLSRGDHPFQVRSFFDERAAAFFALGRSKRHRRPSVVITTSGTAVAELLPAAVEAWYSLIPVIFITADRPVNYRGCGAPQAIEQADLLQPFTEFMVDITTDTLPILPKTLRPMHINVCFDEPLLSEGFIGHWSAHNSLPAMREATADDFEAATTIIKEFQRQSKQPLVIVSELVESVREDLVDLILHLNAPAYFEAPSGLREHKKLLPVALLGGEKALAELRPGLDFDGVIRIGRTPTCKFWRLLDQSDSDYYSLPVLSFEDRGYSGLARSSLSSLPLRCLSLLREQATSLPIEGVKTPENTQSPEGLKTEDSFKNKERLETVLNRGQQAQKVLEQQWSHCWSEPAVMSRLSKLIPSQDVIFLGNSLPIRYWDLAASYDRPHPHVYVNRGANGIDGLLATFMGVAAECGGWLIVGDLSALYDLNALALLHESINQDLKIIVINNGGGKIFTPLFNNPLFENQHSYEFSGVAKMFGWSYFCWRDIKDIPDEPIVGPCLVEVRII